MGETHFNYVMSEGHCVILLPVCNPQLQCWLHSQMFGNRNQLIRAKLGFEI